MAGVGGGGSAAGPGRVAGGIRGGRRRRVGLFGPGRRRNGLGPFLAAWAERAGLDVVAAAGRDAARTRDDCAALGERLGHPVEPADDVTALCGRGDLDALIVAVPAAAHAAGLGAALDAGLAVLCEKPLLAPDADRDVASWCDRFTAAERLLVENCQWPELVPEVLELARGDQEAAAGPPHRLEMGLGPVDCGRAMVDDSLSHFLSVIQAVAPTGAALDVDGIEYSTTAADAEAIDLRFTVTARTAAGTDHAIDCTFVLRRCEAQPRPAWITVDGVRVDRRIALPDYRFSLERPDGLRREVDDPLGRLVYRFARSLEDPSLDRIRAESIRIRDRARLFARILDEWRSDE